MKYPKKFVIKVFESTDKERLKPKWLHWCYIPTALFTEFNHKFPTMTKILPEWIEEWALKDFKMEIDVHWENDINKLRDAILNRAGLQYPHIFTEHEIDCQGWTRIWVCDNMRKEIYNHEKAGE